MLHPGALFGQKVLKNKMKKLKMGKSVGKACLLFRKGLYSLYWRRKIE